MRVQVARARRDDHDCRVVAHRAGPSAALSDPADRVVMLSMTFHPRRLRFTVRVTLLAWVLALLAGMVNACQLQPRGTGTSGSIAATQEHRAEHDDGHGRAGNHDPAVDPSKAGCLKFCDDESSALAKGKSALPDLPAPAMLASADWRPAMPVANATTWRSVERPASQGPPLVIRFLRLTI